MWGRQPPSAVESLLREFESRRSDAEITVIAGGVTATGRVRGVGRDGVYITSDRFNWLIPLDKIDGVRTPRQ